MSESAPEAEVRWVTDRGTFLERAEGAATAARQPVVARVDVADPWRAYRRAVAGEWGVFLETRGRPTGWNAFGVDPTDTVTVWPDDVPSTWGSSLEAIDWIADREALVAVPEAPTIPGGWFGWISYDVARELETLPETTARDRHLPRLQFARFDTLASWPDSPPDGPVTLTLSSCPRIGSDPPEALERGREAVLDLARRLRRGSAATPWGDPEAPVEFAPGCDRATYRDRVNRVKSYVRDGDTFQVNLSQRFDAPARIHPRDAYGALRGANPAPYCGLLETPDVDLASTSPELLLERDGRAVRTEPIAGTRPRGDTPEEDERLADELRRDPKERAEHAMLVDLERNDLGKVCVPGSVTVAEYRRVDRYASVWHLVSDVRGRLEEDVTLGDAVAAVIPGGTVTGAPKPRTMEIIDELEDRRRGPYTGSMAAIGFDGRLRANMVIRTLEHHAGRYRLRVGGGIVHDSDPDAEYDETLAKAAAMRAALEGDEG